MGVPTRFPFGVTNAKFQENMGDMGQLDPTKFHTYFNDFDRYAAADWVITTTEAGAGDATEALADADGGVLLITNDAASGDNDFFQTVAETYTFTPGKRLFFKSRFKVSDATLTSFVMGLQVRDISPLAVSDGVYFLKSTGSTAVSFILAKTSTLTTQAAVYTCVADTYMELGFYYNGVDKVTAFNANAGIYTQTTLTNLPTTELTVSFGIQNGEAVAKTMSIDYLFVAKER